MYLIGIQNESRLCGNSGTFITHYKSKRKITECAETFKKMYGHHEVYGIRDYSQALCEMNNEDFITTIRRIGEKFA